MEVVQDPVGFFTSLDDWTSPHPEDYGNEDSQEPFGSVSQSSETYTVGFVIVNIVGIQHYSGTISGQEMVELVREPLNPNGQNAIKVLNTRAIQVGYIDESAAKVLAPLIDNNLISVEGIVANLPRTGNLFKIPVRILILTNQEAFAQVKSAILMGGLQLIPNNDAPFTFSEAVLVKEPKAVLMKEPKTTSMEGRTWDEIFKLVYENVSKKSAIKALEPPKGVIKSELFLHQKEGLGWLIHRENPCELPTFWEEKRGGTYINVLTNCRTDRRPEPLQGGIFADDMGLGKTLTLLSLIAFDKCGKEAKRGRESENDSDTGKKRKTEDTHLDKMVEGKPVGQLDDGSGLKSTLIVCPPSVISTWVAQLGEHTRAGSFKTYLYYGVRTQDAEELKKHDIVLTTYGTLASEEAFRSETPVKKIEWWRIILDEGHVIKNINAKQSIAVTNLNAKRRWVVTGTPIQNGSWDLFSLMAFLRFKPFSNPSYWNSLVQRPLAEGNEKGLLRLQGLLASISLRRTKDKTLIGLPRKTIETCFVELSAEQRELYDQKENEAKSFVRKYIHPDSLTINYSTVLGIILRLRQICADLALCTSDLIFPSTNIEDVSKNPELLRKMVSFLQDGEDLDCPICISPPSDIVISRCAHVFCRSCILRSLNLSKHSCPLCRRKLSESDLFSSPPESSDTDNSEVSPSSTSSKVPALLKLLSASRDQNPATKSVVFSQFPKMLILIGELLKANGFKILRLDGSMNAKRRGRVIQEFGIVAPDGPTVLLASLKVAGTGINLTSASTVYLLEPWWNPAVEDQAMDRVHRLGQKEDVKIVRMIAQNSIEERILELQEKRRKLASGRKGRKDKKEMSIDDLRTLLPL